MNGPPGSRPDHPSDHSHHGMADTLADLERGLRSTDAAFVHAFDTLERREAAAFATMASLLALTTMLLAAGLALLSPVLWMAGLASFASAVVLDQHGRRQAVPLVTVGRCPRD